MINLCNRTEYSFRLAFGHLSKVLDANPEAYAGICDRHSTWGHVAFEKECKKRGKKAILGVELAVVEDATLNEKQGAMFLRFIAKDNVGLAAIYRLVTKATEQFYYYPRIDMRQVAALPDSVYILTSRPLPTEGLTWAAPIGLHIYLDLHPGTSREAIAWAKQYAFPPVATSDNFYPNIELQNAYEICIGKNADQKTTPMYILDEYQWALSLSDDIDEAYRAEALSNAKYLADSCTAALPKAVLVKPKVDKTLRQMCIDGAPFRKLDLNDPVYKARLDRELELIAEKEYEDYFFLIADLVIYAKQHMLVGPARGSSCGSLVCYLLQITDIDPIPYSLLFERFIDINRKDLPDIDIDFPEDRREMVFEYLRDKYGSECVAQLGTVSRYKAKITIGDVAKELNIPAWEVKELKDQIIERSGGDARAAFCIMDTFEQLDIGRKLLEKYPELSVASEIEAHARHSGRHAAGIVVTADPVFNYCSVDVNTGSTQVDKYDAEELNLLKIDALGLRTLTLIQDCLDQVGMSREELQGWPLDDRKAFDVINNKRFTGIFQFEGQALQSLCHQIEVTEFEDIVAITALARPGPLIGGMANEWLRRKSGQSKVVYEHPILEKILNTSLGIVIYQENIMQIAREIGGMSWEDVSSLRKAMSKSLGKEFFDKYKEKFLNGAEANKFDRKSAEDYWDKINSFGSWAFNRSHAVAYGTVSYWCLVLKAYHPLEYAAACLRHSKDEDQQIRLLRELTAEGYEHTAFDPEKSEHNWSVQDGRIIGGLIGVKGIGEKTALDIVKRKAEGRHLTPKQTKLIMNATTPYDNIFEARSRWGHIFDNPKEHQINTKLTVCREITQESDGTFCIIAKIKEKNLRDLNELIEVKKRGGKILEGQTLFLNLVLEDDTDTLPAKINQYNYEKYGLPIVEEGKIGDWYVFKGRIGGGFRKLRIDRWKKLS